MDKFALFYVVVISFTLVGALFADGLNPAWKRRVFTFSAEVQKVVGNGTAVMEVRWRWLPDTLEMIIKVNDDDFIGTLADDWYVDQLGLLFDSDHNHVLTSPEVAQSWNDTVDDHGVFAYSKNISCICAECYIVINRYLYWDYYNNSVMPQFYSGGGDAWGVIAVLNDSYCLCDQGEGYTFKLTIPRSLIHVEPPTPIHVSFTDSDVIHAEYNQQNKSYQDTIAADFTG